MLLVRIEGQAVARRHDQATHTSRGRGQRARQLAQALSAAGVDVQHEEFEDGHRGLSYRYDRSLPLLTRALAGVPDTDPA